MLLPNWVGIFDDSLMPNRGRRGKGGGGGERKLTETLKRSEH